jgi:uncharacterized OsmC-like protein
MRISAHVQNSLNNHQTTVTTNGKTQPVLIASKPTGFGSNVNGGELLFLALATCFCNDIYREAEKQGIQVESVEIDVEGDFGGPGDPAQGITYRARVTAQASQEAISTLIVDTDKVAEIHNTLRFGTPVVLEQIEALVA